MSVQEPWYLLHFRLPFHQPAHSPSRVRIAISALRQPVFRAPILVADGARTRTAQSLLHLIPVATGQSALLMVPAALPGWSRCVLLRIPAMGACGLAFTSTRSTFRSCSVGPGTAGEWGLLGGQLVAQAEAQQRPDLVRGVLAGDAPANLGIEVLGRSAGGLAGDGEAVAQHQDAEGQ